jgi:hypothetical protein
MKIRQYLLYEAGRSVVISEKEMKSLLKTDFNQIATVYENSKYRIYRGVWSMKNYLYIDPAKNKERESQNTFNYYTWIINNHPVWKNYPRREVICTSNIDTAIKYGHNVYVVYPQNGAKIGICPESDIWISFGNTIPYDLNQFNERLCDFFIKKQPKTLEGFKKALSKIETQENDVSPYNIILNYIKAAKEKMMSLWDYLAEELISPDKNDFKVLKVSKNLDLSSYNDNEIWTDSPCLLLKD